MGAIISPCGRYRPRLDRVVDMLGGPVSALIGVNPSTANATENDATIRKDLGFAEIHGWSRIIKANKFDYRSKDVKALAKCDAPNSPDADRYLREIMTEADIVVPCWGPLAKLPKHLRSRWLEVVAIADELGKPLWCIGTTKDGQPRHTLMTPYSTPLTRWEIP